MFNIYRKKDESKDMKLGYRLQIAGCSFMLQFFLLLFPVTYYLSPALAIVDPMASPNNRFGIHIISATDDELFPAAELVNSSGGDWGYVTVLIEAGDRNKDKWRTFFEKLRKKHLIPIVRIATTPEGNNWKVPTDGEENIWAEFLNSLPWPIKNRYVVIYNEPNQGQEWGGQVDPVSYAKTLDKTISALKSKSDDFFVLNAGLDASAPLKAPLYQDESSYLAQMEQAVPGIFNKLDGWVSHSYPNPGFAGLPGASGRGSVRTWAWELRILNNLGLTKQLPVFITETGWKHAEGLNYDKSLPTSDVVGEYLINAFEYAWNNNRIIAVTPFLLTYQDAPFDHFSFKKLSGEKQSVVLPGGEEVLGTQNPGYYSQYYVLKDLAKFSGRPYQEEKWQFVSGGLFPALVAGEGYTISLTFKNTGQSTWNEYEPVDLKIVEGHDQFKAEVRPSDHQKIEPGQQGTFLVDITAPSSGTGIMLFNLSRGQVFNQDPVSFTTQITSPVILKIKSGLEFKDNPVGEYLLSITSDVFNSVNNVNINEQGESEELEARYLLPEHNFNFTLQKTYYKSKTISLEVKPGVNILDFDKLNPDFISALLKPQQLWKLLPFSK